MTPTHMKESGSTVSDPEVSTAERSKMKADYIVYSDLAMFVR